MAKKQTKVPVTERALMQRCNRKLAEQEEMLKKWRSSGSSGGSVWEPGDIYHIDYRSNVLIDGCVDLESLGREIGVLKDWEALSG